VGKPSLNAAQPYAKAEGRVFLLVPAYPGCPGTKAVKRLLLLLLLYMPVGLIINPDKCKVVTTSAWYDRMDFQAAGIDLKAVSDF